MRASDGFVSLPTNGSMSLCISAIIRREAPDEISALASTTAATSCFALSRSPSILWDVPSLSLPLKETRPFRPDEAYLVREPAIYFRSRPQPYRSRLASSASCSLARNLSLLWIRINLESRFSDESVFTFKATTPK